jgi:hypothetical protein
MNGRHEAAVQVFHKAAALFVQSRILAKQRLPLLDQPDERIMVTRLVNAPREAYCQARITLEEAIVAESREDYRTSLEKFGLASDKLAEVSTLSESEEDRRETGFLSTLCRAWQLSDRAELEGPTELLDEARLLFVRARDMSAGERARKLASGHEAFCKALMASRKFADSLDPVYHKDASRQLDLAASYYLDSGFKTASDHAIARKLLLDASAQLNSANNERDQRKKAELYKLAGALLHESAQAFLRAQQFRKREQALGLLEKAKMESKIAFRLTEILDAASGAPTNVAFHSPASGDEKAVGL